MSEVKTALEKYKTGLASHTSIENMVAMITQKYMRKYASDDTE